MNRLRFFAAAVVLVCWSFVFADDAKLPIPPDPAQEPALSLIKEIYGQEWVDAKSDEQKQVLAKKLLNKAAESQDPNNKYVLLRVARDISTDVGDGLTAFRAIEEMDRWFQVDSLTMQASVLHAFTKKARLPAEHGSIAEKSLDLLDAVVARDDFDTASKLAVMALEEAEKTRDEDFVNLVVARKKVIEQLATAYAEVQVAAKTLEDDPTDPEANLRVGKYRCLLKADWDNGLPMLALGSDPVLKALALQDMESASGHAGQAELGDAWWDAAEDEAGVSKRSLQERAGDWYQRAMPGLAGLVKSKVEKRLDSLADSKLTDALPANTVLAFSFEKDTIFTRGRSTFVRDLSGSGHDGIIQNARLGTGSESGTIRFGRENQYVDVPGPWTLGKDFSIAVWVKFDHLGSSYSSIIHGEDDQIALQGHGPIAKPPTGRGRVGYHSAKSTSGVGMSTTIEINRWYFVAVTDEGHANTIYLDGHMSNTRTKAKMDSVPPLKSIRIGSGYSDHGKSRLNGSIGELLIVKRVLSADEVRRLYENTQAKYR